MLMCYFYVDAARCLQEGVQVKVAITRVLFPITFIIIVLL